MRINKFLAQTTNLSRRNADLAIEKGRVKVNDKPATLGQNVEDSDAVTLDGVPVTKNHQTTTIMLNKPVGYVCSRDGQGSKTIYSLLPMHLHHLNPVGRLDKDSSGLLLMTNDGDLANKLAHPKFHKNKIYDVSLTKPLPEHTKKQIEDGVLLEDGMSTLELKGEGKDWTVTMHEGRNRQIRRTFENVGFTVRKLHRTQIDKYKIGQLSSGKFDQIKL